MDPDVALIWCVVVRAISTLLKKTAELVDLKPETQIRVEGYCTEGCEGSWGFFCCF